MQPPLIQQQTTKNKAMKNEYISSLNYDIETVTNTINSIQTVLKMLILEQKTDRVNENIYLCFLYADIKKELTQIHSKLSKEVCEMKKLI